MPFSCCANFYDSSRPLELEHSRCLWAAVMEQNDSDDESVTPTLPGFVRASKPPAPPGFVRPASSRAKKKASGADVAAAYRAAVRRPKASAPEPSVAVGPARMATCAACGATYDPLAREAHEASIAHQLAVGPRTRGRRVMLPEANPGAKLCGNQTSGAPRHRRDVVPTNTSARWQPLAHWLIPQVRRFWNEWVGAMTARGLASVQTAARAGFSRSLWP